MSANAYAELMKAMEMAHVAMAADLGYPGWTYRDIPWVTEKVWNEFMELAGEGNTHIIICSCSAKTDSMRGQVLISPDGMARLQARAALTQDSGNGE